jgi:GT2 family glycosyltransferase
LVNNASGKYISFIATDDAYLPEKISAQVAIMENCPDSVALVYSDTYLMDSSSRRRFGTYMTTHCQLTYEFAPSGNVLEELQETHFLHWLSALVRRDVYNTVGNYDENLSFEDYDMSLRIARKFEIQYMPDIHTVYRVHSASMSRKVVDWQIYFMPLYLKHLDLPKFRERAANAIFSAYLKKNKNTLTWLQQYNSVTNKRVRLQSWINAGVPPYITRQYLRAVHFLRRLLKKIK